MIGSGLPADSPRVPPPPRRASPDDYRDLMSAFPTGVAVVTSIDHNGRPRGMTCSSLSSVTLAPPTLLACLRTGSATHCAVRYHGSFAVNLLHAGGRHAAELFSSAVEDRFGLIRWRPSYSGLPWLVADAFALAECTVSGTAEVGDHTVVFGTVDEVIMARATPLLYGMRRFSAFCAEPSPRHGSRHAPNGLPGAR
jgi:flavin reductase (NADH)